jgi:GcrA cell cycle regulator
MTHDTGTHVHDPDPPSPVKRGYNSTHWPSERSERLAGLVAAGHLSYSQIAAVLSAEFGTAYSRNACIGRAGRMGLSNPFPVKAVKKEPVPRPPRPKRSSSARRIRSAPAAEEVKLRCVEIVPRLISLIDLEPDDCRYPYGDTSILFCGHPRHGAQSYCAPHHSITQYQARKITEADHELRRRHFIALMKKASFHGFTVPAA